VELFDQATSKHFRCDVAPFEELDRFRVDPVITNLGSIRHLGQKATHFLETRKIDQHPAKVEKENVELSFASH